MIVSVADIAKALSVSGQAIRKRLTKDEWQPETERGKGGSHLFKLDKLPMRDGDRLKIKNYLLDQQIAALPETCCPLPAIKTNNALVVAEDLPAPASLAKWQRDTMDARFQILMIVDQLAQTTSLNKAIDRVIDQSKNGLLPENVAALIQIANARSGKGEGEGKRTLSRRTLFRWRELRAIGTTAVAPVELKKRPIPAWAPLFLKCYQRPQKPSVPMALETLETVITADIPMPSESQARRFLNKMSKVDREKGRRSHKEMRALKPYRQRDTSDLLPLDVCQCDGHSFKARIAHPVHGKPFHPEVCAVIDAATRVVIGWSAGLAESAQTVADALRHAIDVNPNNERGGIPAIFYTDPGSGNKAKVNANPVFGRYARLGITFKTGIVGNSQARGLVERLQQSLWIKAAKQLPTFTGKDMDSSVEHKTYKLLMSDVRGTTNSNKLPSWPQFLDLCQQAVDRYNNTPHSSLPKITDQNGKRRYMTPNEMYDSFTATGWLPSTVDQQELADLFRPRVQVKTFRGNVRLFGNIYSNSALQHHNREQVFVEYEPQNGQFVYVRDMDDRLICKAEFEANKSSMFPVSAIEDATEKRTSGQLKRLAYKQDNVLDERRGVTEIFQSPLLIAEAQAQATAELMQLEAEDANVTKLPTDNAGRFNLYRKLTGLKTAGEELDPDEAEWLTKYLQSSEGKSMVEFDHDFGLDTAKNN